MVRTCEYWNDDDLRVDVVRLLLLVVAVAVVVRSIDPSSYRSNYPLISLIATAISLLSLSRLLLHA